MREKRFRHSPSTLSPYSILFPIFLWTSTSLTSVIIDISNTSVQCLREQNYFSSESLKINIYHTVFSSLLDGACSSEDLRTSLMLHWLQSYLFWDTVVEIDKAKFNPELGFLAYGQNYQRLKALGEHLSIRQWILLKSV